MRIACPAPDFETETLMRARGFRAIAGVDEAGRGPLAGPVVAAAVILEPSDIPTGLADSKTLTAARRETIAAEIRARARFAIAEASVEEIDALNILQASHLAMRRALAALDPGPDMALIDGNRMPGALPCGAETLVRGDARCLSIAAASIVAKVARDAIMARLAREFPAYGWDRNAGYPVPAHLAGLNRWGPTPYHRRSFAPVRKILCEEYKTTL
ncbi:ribonuclease HII [Pararhodobacter sp. SW119]|uniref:ribonuclease HII n=1 Tax=Pararhodobacter sp. SW119 TaxID=2780075 RepID=UPI001ADECDF2|nr:ribonuclease HII [Pararhodobacter sp. SW119]